MNIFLTGSTGFLGRAVVERLVREKHQRLVLPVRRKISSLPNSVQQVMIDNLCGVTDWLEHLVGIDVIVHSAARAHIMNDTVKNPLLEFRKVNTDVTLNLAKQAAQAGVKRFIFISSIKVNGGSTQEDLPFTTDETLVTSDPYGISKREAEQGLRKIAQETGLEVVIIRPPLVYGPGVKANFRSLIKWMSAGVPLPLGAVYNQRSFVALDNLVGFIVLCMRHPRAVGETFLISDGEDVSTTVLLRKIAQAAGKRPLLLPIPVWLMAWAASVLGKRSVADRLFSSLQVDSSKAKELLGWRPVVTMDEQLKKVVEAYNNEKNI